ncbi:hypothetical protein [Ruminococcus sp.]|uniref:hypothetical protein n=1 Tax=Ruminococcus sp. TaxID=41978 RepID=UPI001B45DDE4|nr:hypothetical protein [Ruminococcus sp.]MBP5431036.1 hypothetical protein [Ruminococcus sp.]
MNEAKSILEMAQGAIMEQVNVEVSRIVDNILDPNTDAKKKRQLVLTVDFTPSSDRSAVVVSATAKSKLLPNNAIQTTLYVGADASTGEVQAVEMVPQIPGQQGFDGSIQQEPKIMKIAGGMR